MSRQAWWPGGRGAAGRVAALFEDGIVHRRAGRHQEALVSFEAVLALEPAHLDALEKRGNTLLDLHRPAEALECYDAVLIAAPTRLDSRFNRGLALLRLQRPREALQVFEALVRDQPGDVEAWVNRGNAQSDLRELASARSSYETALRLQPDHVDALHNLALVLQELRQPDRASVCFKHLQQLRPDYPQLAGKLLHARMQACDWTDLGPLLAHVEEGLRRGVATAEPFGYQGISADPALQRRCAELAAGAYRSVAEACLASRSDAGRRVRVGYVSGEFRQQATSVLAVELFESHDRRRFEVFAFDNGWDDGSALRRRIMAAFDAHVDIAHLSDAEAARAVRERGIDVLVDLNGWFGLGRPGMFALRPAPVQVNYLGFPGTVGAAWMDYLMADSVLVTDQDRRFYSEQVVRLPGSYQPNDSRRARPGQAPSRAAAGLPAEGFVFCCFNNNYKITPQVFAVWMRLLAAVPGSVLWLLGDNAAAQRNLRARAQAAGIEPPRLVFAPRRPLDEHLGRQTLADLFLDTTPCNAHTTASDALWAGVPVVTCTGATFSSRVAASLLRSLGLEGLVTHDLPAYEALALALASDPQTLQQWRSALAARRDDPDCGLFNGAVVARHLEAAYLQMVARQRGGEPPMAFDVAAD